MEAIILAGGLGTRLKSIAPHLPKSMVPIAGKPFLEILLTMLAYKGFHRVVLSLGYMSNKIISYFGDRFIGMTIVYEVEQVPLGTGGAVRQALTKCVSDHVFVFNGDTYLDLEVTEVESQWQSNRLPMIIACKVSDTARYGRLEVARGCVTGFCEKNYGGIGLINAGCYVLPKNFLNDYLCENNFSLENDFLIKKVKNERIDVFISKGFFIDIGVPEDFVRAQTELKEQALQYISKTV